MTQLTWSYNSFDELTPASLYAILRLRSEVFVVEQNCVYLDADNKDKRCIHVTGRNGDTIAAYCRILPPGISYETASIGRVLTSPAYRNSGIGRELMSRAINFTLHHFSCTTITISAQLYLEKFYSTLGFVKISEPYPEDHIPHIKMQFKL